MSDDAELTTNLSKVIEGEHSGLTALKRADDVLLAKLGYRSEFRREFSVRRFFYLHARLYFTAAYHTPNP